MNKERSYEGTQLPIFIEKITTSKIIKPLTSEALYEINTKLTNKQVELLKSTRQDRRNSRVIVRVVPSTGTYSTKKSDTAADTDYSESIMSSSTTGVYPIKHQKIVRKKVLTPVYTDFLSDCKFSIFVLFY